MAEYKHGVYVNEASTDLLTLSQQSAGVIVAIGTAPIGRAANPAPANKPISCTNYNEAVSQLGYSTDTKTYTLCEAMEVLYGLYQVSPIVFVNVLDPSKHKEVTTRAEKTVPADRKIVLTGPDILLETVTIEDADGDDVSFNKSKTASGVELTANLGVNSGTTVYVSYIEPKVSAVTAADVEAAISQVSEVYPRFGLTVGLIIAPGYSQNPNVALKLAASAGNINGHFSAIGIADLDTRAISGYTVASNWKNTNGFSLEHLITCYPCVKYGAKVQHLSTHVAGICAKQTVADDDIPYRSPSNKEIYISGMCNEDGSDCYFGQDAANDFLNANGVVTVLQFNGWKLWGNRMSCYPSTSDPKDAWISVRRMFDFIKRALVLNFWSQVDEPILKRQIESLVNSANIYLNGLTARGAILGGRVEFREAENPTTDLADGIVRFRCFFTPPPPCRALEFTLQFDGEYLTTIF